MSQTITMVMVQLLTIGLPLIGVRLGSDALTSFVQTLIVVISGLWIWVRRYQQGDVNVLGARQ